MPTEDNFHNDILDNTPAFFPAESFLRLRRLGLSVEESLDSLDFRIEDLTLVQRALLQCDPHAESEFKALLDACG